MAVCFATLQQFSELENCFIDGTPMNFEETSGKDVVRGGWPVMLHGCGSDGSARDSLDTGDLLLLENSKRRIDSQSRGAGVPLEEGYPQSPVWAHDVPVDYLDGAQWGQLTDRNPSSEQKVAEWMSAERTHTDSSVSDASTEPMHPSMGPIQARRSGERSRSIILRYEAEQRLKRRLQQQLESRPTPTQGQFAPQDSRMKRRKRTDSTSSDVGVERAFPSSPRKLSLKQVPMDFRNAQYEVHIASLVKEQSIAYQQWPEQQSSPQASQNSQYGGNGSRSMPRPMMMPRTSSGSKSMSSKQSAAQEAYMVPKDSQKGHDEELGKLESGHDSSWGSIHSRTRFDDVDIDKTRQTLDLAAAEETHKRERPLVMDMGTVLDRNRQSLLMELEKEHDKLLSEMEQRKRDSGTYCTSTPEEIDFYPDPSQLLLDLGVDEEETIDSYELSQWHPYPKLLIPRALFSGDGDSPTLGDREIDFMSPFEQLESTHDRFRRHSYFFDNRPLYRCLDGHECEIDSDMLYDRLLEDTRLRGLVGLVDGHIMSYHDRRVSQLTVIELVNW